MHLQVRLEGDHPVNYTVATIQVRPRPRAHEDDRYGARVGDDSEPTKFLTVGVWGGGGDPCGSDFV